jgi:multidrug efflux system membrane fusion protein
MTHREGKSWLAKWILLLLAVAGLSAGAWYWHQRASEQPTTATEEHGRAPVDIIIARQEVFPVHLNGLGVVQAWNTVTIRTRVDGQIDKIAFEEGQTVKQGDLLLRVDPRPYQAALDQALAKKALDEALLENSRRDLVRFKTVGSTVNSQQQIDTQEALVGQQEAQIKADQGSIDNARVQVGYTTITAPIAGRMGFRQVDKGNIVHASETQGIAVIMQLQPIAVVFTAPEDELPRISEAMKTGPLPVTALTSDGKTELGQGAVTLIDNRVATGSIPLKARFDNPNNALWPGLTVATRLQIEILKDVVVIPEAAVQRGPSGLFAYVINEKDEVEIHNLDISKIEDGRAAIGRGITAGERVVTAGFYLLQPGAPVEIRKTNTGSRSGNLPATTSATGAPLEDP